MAQTMNTWVRLQNIDRRILYTILIMVVAIPLLNPIGLPLKITRETQSAFDAIDRLPAGSLVMFATSINPGVMAEMEPQALAIIQHLINLDLKIVFNPYVPDAARYVDRYVDMCVAQGYQLGVDVMSLPYQAGAEMLYAAMGTDLKSAYEGVPSSPLWDSISSARSFSVWIDSTPGEGMRWAAAHIGAVHGIPIVASMTAGGLATSQPYYSSGQLIGMIAGLSGAAEYEVLARAPGKGASGMDAQSLGHMTIIIFIAIGNVAFFGARGHRRAAGGGN